VLAAYRNEVIRNEVIRNLAVKSRIPLSSPAITKNAENIDFSQD
jgi:hypothetical protein